MKANTKGRERYTLKVLSYEEACDSCMIKELSNGLDASTSAKDQELLLRVGSMLSLRFDTHPDKSIVG